MSNNDLANYVEHIESRERGMDRLLDLVNGAELKDEDESNLFGKALELMPGLNFLFHKKQRAKRTSEKRG